MKKEFKLLIIIILLLTVLFGVYKFLYKSETNDNKKSENKVEEKTSVIKYYSYEGNGKFTMSSISNKVDNLKDLNNNYYIKEKITKEKSNEKIIEILYNDFEREPYLYGYYSESDFNKYFSDQIKNGLVCDNKTEIALGEGVNIKCILHDLGFEYEKIDSELCSYINDKEICIKPNDWNNIEKYKEQFENVGWICEYQDFDTGKWNKDVIPNNGNLECSEEGHSKHSDNKIFCFIGTDGAAVCNNNVGWCGINDDLNTYCFGVN